MMHVSRHLRSHTPARFLIVCLTVTALLLQNSCGNSLERSFDGEKWKDGNSEVRGSMLCDLLQIEKGLWHSNQNLFHSESRFQNMERADVVELLGPPDSSLDEGMTFEWGSCTGFVMYGVGFLDEEGLLQNPFKLLVGFDDKGKVSLIQVVD